MEQIKVSVSDFLKDQVKGRRTWGNSSRVF